MEDKAHKCSSIEHSKIDATIFCKTCKVFLCNKCQNNFHSKIFPNHQIENLNDEKKDIFTGICYEKNHLSKLDYFCKNHNTLCCAKCISKIKDEDNGQHKDCNIVQIKEIKSEKEKKFKENYEKLKQMSNNLENDIDKFKELKEKINKNKEELIINIQKTFTKIRTDLNEREDKLLNKVEEIYKNLYYDEKNSREIERLSNKVKQILESNNNIKDKNNELSYEINNYIQFEKNFDKVEEIHKIMANCFEKKVKISFKYNNNELDNIIKNFGEIKEEKDIDEEEVDEIYQELEDDYGISGYIEEAAAKLKIRELNLDREAIIEWIENVVVYGNY